MGQALETNKLRHYRRDDLRLSHILPAKGLIVKRPASVEEPLTWSIQSLFEVLQYIALIPRVQLKRYTS